MKYLFATLVGLALTLGTFAGGIAFSINYLAADRVPVKKPYLDASLVFHTGVVRVDSKQQDYERIEARSVPEPKVETGSFIAEVELSAEIDDMTTASLSGPDVSSSSTLSDAHVNWCNDRYRSYQPETNSYTPYGGGSRECVSPFSEETRVASDEATLIQASAAGSSDQGFIQQHASSAQFGDEHLISCFHRYQSYRPEDNSYQPYGGGPREQCQ